MTICPGGSRDFLQLVLTDSSRWVIFNSSEQQQRGDEDEQENTTFSKQLS